LSLGDQNSSGLGSFDAELINVLVDCGRKGKAIWIDEVKRLRRLRFPNQLHNAFCTTVASQPARGSVLLAFNIENADSVVPFLANFLETVGIGSRSSIFCEQETLSEKFLDSLGTVYSWRDKEDESRQFFEAVIDAVSDFCSAERCSFLLYDESSQRLNVAAMKGMDWSTVEGVDIKASESIAARVFAERSALLVRDMQSDRRFPASRRSSYKTSSFISVPIQVRDQPVGVLNVTDRTNRAAFGDKDLKALLTLSAAIGHALEKRQCHKDIQRLEKLSSTDYLTGLFNRRFFEQRLEEEVTRSRRYGRELSLIFADIDEFKRINDTYGHTVGDKALKVVSEAFSQTLRKEDVAARVGGDEFAAIFAETSQQVVRSITIRLVERVKEFSQVKLMDKIGQPLTICIGGACFPTNANSSKELVRKADQALLAAKKQGRNTYIL
jgi:diguanylate cyclase (GGDEF)-like protein